MLVLRRSLKLPSCYRAFRWILRGKNKNCYLQDYLKIEPGFRVLDLGCGPADLLADLPDCEYLGIDADRHYIDAAKRSYGNRGEFICGFAEESSVVPESFDLVMANGLLHHLTDAQVKGVFQVAAHALKPGARLVTLDPTLVQGQSWFARRMIRNDRGEYVRSPEGYLELAKPIFQKVKLSVRHDLLRIPYSHCILSCKVPG